ncbi:hypothetical protein [Nocardioides ferulae]|uniref:hypothetical protein n=1 Tax=Nocardioides ferulae TaxID=2340821 RepID=UPI000EB27FCF|nr:hypothetical protein [Nocardioides ferulae]
MRPVTTIAVAAALTVALTSAPAPAASPIPHAPDELGAQGGRSVTLEAPRLMILRPSCREDYRATAVFDAVEGEEVFAIINGTDGNGRSIEGGTFEGTVGETGEVRLDTPLTLCGSLAYAGTGRIALSLSIDDDPAVELHKRVSIKYDDTVSLRRASRAGGRTSLRGSWSRGKGFERGLTTYVQESVTVQLWFRPNGAKWSRVARTGIDSQGRWNARVPVSRAGSWQARIAGSKRLLPARSAVRNLR